MNCVRPRQIWQNVFRGNTAVVCTLVGICLVSACKPSQEPERQPDEKHLEQTEQPATTGERTGPDCSSLKRQLTDLRNERDSLESKRDDTRDQVADLEEATEQLEAFEPALNSTTVHINPSNKPPPREISGYIKNGTDETVAIMHLDATFVPSDPERDAIEQEVAYKLHEPIEPGKTDHSPYGQQLIDAFPGIDTEVWVEGTLELEPTALEGPDGEMLWDRRDRDIDSLQKKLTKLDDRLTSLDQGLTELRQDVASCPRR